MHHLWQVAGAPEETRIVRRFNADIPEGAAVLAPEEASWQVYAWFPDDLPSRWILADLCADLGVLPLISPRTPTERLRAEVQKAFSNGLLVAYRIAHATSSAALGRERAESQNAKEPPTPVESPKAWVAIELLDDSDPPRPVGFKKYRIELLDQSVREGMLDENGQAWIYGIDPGTCLVSFPQFDAEEWQPA